MASLRDRQIKADAAQFDAMCEARPLKPPPTPSASNPVRRTGEIELAAEIRAGHYERGPLYQFNYLCAGEKGDRR